MITAATVDLALGIINSAVKLARRDENMAAVTYKMIA